MRKRPHSQRYDGPESSRRKSLWKEFMVAKAQKHPFPGYDHLCLQDARSRGRLYSPRARAEF